MLQKQLRLMNLTWKFIEDDLKYPEYSATKDIWLEYAFEGDEEMYSIFERRYLLGLPGKPKANKILRRSMIFTDVANAMDVDNKKHFMSIDMGLWQLGKSGGIPVLISFLNDSDKIKKLCVKYKNDSKVNFMFLVTLSTSMLVPVYNPFVEDVLGTDPLSLRRNFKLDRFGKLILRPDVNM